ncbi:MAG TPA: hypothetical protein VKG26_16070 [Bacteroidia bacterium]|nr:hypothetical protein [Bacteroidia bacterium]
MIKKTKLKTNFYSTFIVMYFFNIKNKLTLILFLFFSIFLYSQPPSDVILKKRYSLTYYKYKLYASFDFVRMAGLGFEYRSNPFQALDVQAGFIYPNGIFSSGISANDYFYMKGGFISFTAKKYIGRCKHFYIGFYNAFHYYGYNKKWAYPGTNYPYYGDDYSDYPPQELRDRRTFSFTLAPCIGGAITVNNISIEPYLAVGPEFTYDKLTVFEQTSTQNPYYQTYSTFPSHYSSSNAQLNVVCGIKIGLCKKPTTTYSYRYYVKNVKIQTQDVYVEAINLYRYKVISAQQIDDFKQFRSSIFKNIKNYSRTSNSDTTYLNNSVIQSVKSIQDYFNSHFKANSTK